MQCRAWKDIDLIIKDIDVVLACDQYKHISFLARLLGELGQKKREA